MNIVCKMTFLIALLFLLTTWLLWKMKKIHIRFNFGSKEKAVPKHYEIKALLDEISGEIIVASQAFYAWKSIHNFASKDNTLHKAINSNALSWNIFLHSLQATFFISLGRIFNTNPQSCSIHFLFRYCKNNIKEFEKDSLKKRRIKEAGKEPDYLSDFLKKAYEPTQSDFKSLKKEVTRVQNIYETHFRPVRHKIFAHKDSDHISDTSLLFAGTTIKDAENILETLHKVERVIWDLYTNGKQMNFDYWELKEEEYILKDTESLLKKL